MEREDGEISDQEEDDHEWRPTASRPPRMKQERLFNAEESFNSTWGWLGENNRRSYESQGSSSIFDRQFQHEPPQRSDMARRSFDYADEGGTFGQSPRTSIIGNERRHFSDGNHYGLARHASTPLQQRSYPRTGNVARQTEPVMTQAPARSALRFQKPPPLPENIPVAEKYEKWLDWKGVFDVALSVCDARPTEQQKASLLFTSVGQETQKAITLLGLPPMHRGGWGMGSEYEELSQGLNSFFRGMVDEAVDYSRFHDAKQSATEGIHDYTLRLRGLASCVNVEPASFAFRHQVLKGMRNKELATKAGDMNIPLGELIRIAARKEQREHSNGGPANPWESQRLAQPAVSAVTSGGHDDKTAYSGKRQANRPSSGAPESKMKSCRYCGGRQHSNKKECPAFGKECRGCGAKNHFMKVCEKKKQKQVNAVTDAKQEDDFGKEIKV